MTLARTTDVLSAKGSGRAHLRAVAVSMQLASISVACGGTPAQVASPQSETVGEPAVATEPAAKETVSSPRRLAGGVSWTFRQTTLLAHGPDRSFDADTARRQFAEPKWNPASKGELWVVIDRGNPRPLSGRQPVTQLLDETLELAPGWHRLVVYRSLQSERVVEYEVRSFSVDLTPAAIKEASLGAAEKEKDRDAASQAQPRSLDSATQGETGCILLTPRGTYNGDAAADALEVLGLPLAAPSGLLVYHLGDEMLEAPAGQALVVSQLPSGDHVFSLECTSPDGDVIEHVSRTVTVNRDQAPEIE